jgi:hypothetical protein
VTKLALVAVAALVLAAGASADVSYVIRGDRSFAGLGFRDTLASSTKVLGTPSSVRTRVGRICIARWNRHGVVIQLVSFEPNPCKTGSLLSANLTGPRWRTTNGLRVGDPVTEIARKHPRAKRHRDGWWLATRRTCELGGNQPYGSLVARTGGGHVTAFFFTGSVCD